MAKAKKVEAMPISQFGAHPSDLGGGYLLFGEEDYLKRHYFDAVKKATVEEGDIFNHYEINSDNYTPSMLINCLEALPVMADKKLVEMRDMAGVFAQKDTFEQLCDILSTADNYPETLTVLYLLDGEANETVISKLSGVLKPVEAKRETPPRVAKWASRHFGENGVYADLDCCMKIAENCNCDMFTVAGEIDKLSAYVKANGRERLEMKDVTGLTADVFETTSFGLANAILSGNASSAFEIIRDCEVRKEKEEIVLSGITSTLCDLYAIKLYQVKGMPVSVAASELKWHEYKAKLYNGSASKIEIGRIENILGLCRNADLMIKSGTTEKYLIIERLAAEAIIKKNGR